MRILVAPAAAGEGLTSAGPVVLRYAMSQPERPASLPVIRDRPHVSDHGALLHAMLRSLPDLVWLKDPDGVYLGCNHRFEALYGYPEEQIVGRTDHDFVDRDTAEFFRAHDRAAIEAGDVLRNEETLTFSDGHVERCETLKRPLYTAGGELIGVLGIARDLGPMTAAQEALVERERMFEAVVDQSADAMALIDGERFQFVLANDAACEMLGYAREELLALTVRDIDAADPPFDPAALTTEMVTTGYSRFESVHRRKDGVLREVEISLRPMKLDGRMLASAVWRDVTESRRARLALEASEQQLRNAQAIASLGSWEVDPSTNRVTLSGETMRIYGVDTPEGDLTELLRSRVHPDDLDAIDAPWADVAQGTTGPAVEYRIIVDGEVRWVRARAQPQLDVDGRVVRIIGISQDISDARAALDLLAARERELHRAQEIARLGSWTIEPQTGAVLASPETRRIHGLTKPPVSFESMLESRVVPEDLERVMAAWRATGAGTPQPPIEYRMDVRGETRWVRSHGEAEFDEQGRVLRIVGYTQDITEAHEAQAAIEAGRRQYQALFDTAAVSILVHDAQTGEILDANQRALAAYGARSLEDLALDATFAAPPPFGREEALANIRLAATSGRQRFEWLSRDREGNEFWEDTILDLVELEGVERVMAVSVDITERKRAEQELEFHQRHLEDEVERRTAELATANRKLLLSEMRLRSMYDLSQRADSLDEHALLRHGLEEAVRLTGSRIGYVHFINDDGSIELVTWSRETLAQCTAVFDTHYPIESAGVWADSARERRPVIHNDWANTPGRKGLPDGHIAMTRHLGVPVVDAGRVRMLLGVGNKTEPYDDSDADQLTLIGTDLWRIAMRRRAEIELAAAKEAAEAANHAKTTFLANMSHEIRTPMNAIIGLTHLLGTDPVTDRQRGLLRKVSGAAEHLLDIINSILDLAKIEAGKLALEPAGFILADVIDHLHAMTSARADEKGLRLSLTVAPDVPPALHGDGLRVGQVLLNLVGNAIKFTSEGGVDLTVTTSATPDHPDRIRFTVRDSGIGIAPPDLERLFGSFEQADASTTRRYGGSGLGLAICRSLVELMGGTISVESTLGEGSAFNVELELPRVDLAAVRGSEVATPDARRPTEPASRTLVAVRPGARVLLAEDSPLNQLVARELLNQTGVQVDVASDGHAAVRAVETSRYDLVLMDVQMPGLDGLEATRAIRTLPGLDTLPIVAMTANAFDDDRRACLDAGMNDHVAKPVDPEQLYSMLERWIPGDPGDAQASGGAVTETETARDPSGAHAAPGFPTVTAGAAGAGAGLPEADGQVLATVAALGGVDASSWLAGAGASRQTYLNLLGRFIGTHPDDVAMIRARLDAGERTRAGRAARTLERVCSGLGLIDVEVSAGAVALAIDGQEGHPAVDEALGRLEDDLRATVAGLLAAGIERQVPAPIAG